MDQHPGASITLSFGLVAVFAIALYQPEPKSRPRAGPEITAGKPEHPAPALQPRLPELTPGEPLIARPSPAAIAADAEGMRPVASDESRAEPNASVTPRPSVKKPARRSAPVLPPREGFTQSRDGETLRDVAIRVYGSADEAESLWRLNRDLIRRRDGNLPAGTILRTP
jgi:hypothetical protein